MCVYSIHFKRIEWYLSLCFGALRSLGRFGIGAATRLRLVIVAPRPRPPRPVAPRPRPVAPRPRPVAPRPRPVAVAPRPLRGSESEEEVEESSMVGWVIGWLGDQC